MLLLQADALDAEALWSSVPVNTDSSTVVPITLSASIRILHSRGIEEGD